MSVAYRCPTCQSQTTTDDPHEAAPICVGCAVDMVIAGAARTSGFASDECEKPDVPIAPINLGAYEAGLEAIEKAKMKADADEREWLRAKDYTTKAKKRLEASEVDLRDTIKKVADRLRPRPLFEGADHHTDEELLALLSGLNVTVTLEKIRTWTDTERADARAWALAAHSEQPRLIPPFLWAPTVDDDPATAPEGDLLPDDPETPPDDDEEVSEDAPPAASDASAPGPEHWYPRAVDPPTPAAEAEPEAVSRKPGRKRAVR